MVKEIKCPCCNAFLHVDTDTGRVIDHESEQVETTRKMDLASFVKAQPSRAAELEAQFRKSKEDQEKRKKQLDEDFTKAKKDPSSIKGDYINPFSLD